MNATFTISAEGRAVVTGRAVAYDAVATWTFTGVSFAGLSCRLVGVLRGDYPTMTTAFNSMTATGSGTSVVFTVNLSNETVNKYITKAGLPVVVAVIAIATQKILASGEITIEAAPTPTGAAIEDIVAAAALWGDIGGTLTDQLDMVAFFEAQGVASGLVDAHVAAHPVPTDRDERNEAVNVASGLMTTHESAHPVPTDRDARNEAADAAIQVHVTGTGSPHTAGGVGADPAGSAAGVQTNLNTHTTTHPVPTDRDTRNEAVNVASGLLSGHEAAHPVPTNRDARNEAADAAIQAHITGTGSPHTAGGVGADPAGSANTVQTNLTTHETTHPAPTDRDARNEVAAEAVTALPGTPTAWRVYRLTAADGVALAAPGRYVHDSVGWACDQYQAAYALGDLGATPSHTLIAGASFVANANVEVSTWTLTLSVLGLIAITLTNAGGVAVAPPAMAGRTTKLLGSGAWDAVTEPLSKVLIADDGTYLWVSSREGA